MRKTLLAAIASTMVVLPALSAGAATITPADFTRILTEGRRTQTIDGADVSGHAALPDNGDVKSFSRSLDIGEIAPGDRLLLVGAVTAGGADEYFSEGVSGVVQFDVINFAASDRASDTPFNALFMVFLDGVLTETLDLGGAGADLIENQSFGSVAANNQRVGFRVYGTEGASAFDVGLSVTELPFFSSFGLDQPLERLSTVPLPLSLPLLLGGLAALGLAGRTRKIDTNQA